MKYLLLALLVSVLASFGFFELLSRFPIFDTAFYGFIYWINFVITPVIFWVLTVGRNFKVSIIMSFVAQIVFGLFQFLADAEDFPLLDFIIIWMLLVALVFGLRYFNRYFQAKRLT